MAEKRPREKTRKDYAYFLQYRTRWSDNDMYGHMNNSVYNFLYDSAVNTYLIECCGLKPATSLQSALVVQIKTDFYSSISFPSIAEIGLSVVRLGKSSATYEVALFEKGVEGVKSICTFVHVFVEKKTGRPAVDGMEKEMRSNLQSIERHIAKL